MSSTRLDVSYFSGLTLGMLLKTSIVLVLSRLCWLGFYNLYLHPLNKYPGPLLWRLSRIPFSLSVIAGTLPPTVLGFHDKYGPVVRIAPDELAYISAQAWKDIYGHRPGQPSNNKDPFTYSPADSRLPGQLPPMGNGPDHSRIRRTVSHAFSAKALEEQAPLVGRYVDLLIKGLHENASKGPIDLVAWYNWCTFDIIGDLSFGKSFRCLEEQRWHPVVSTILEGVRAGSVTSQFRRFGLLRFARYLVPRSMLDKREALIKHSIELVDERLAAGNDRPDFITAMTKNNPDETGQGLTVPELHGNAFILVPAGSETTATLLSGASYWLLKTPEALKKVVAEVRSSFETQDEIDFHRCSTLPYLMACLNEALRIYPPVPFGLARRTPPNGTMIDGGYVPPNTSISVFQWAASHSKANWTRPDEFIPERWIPQADGSQLFPNDDFGTTQPFTLGSRVCLGKNLAYMEMRVILARLLFNFDIELCPDSENWHDHRSFLLWVKPPLEVKLKSVQKTF